MLLKLSVKNFAIIEDLTVEFKSGMTVLSGQTGAGKSLIIDSISLLLGQRGDNDMIRYGADKAYIEGVFTYDNPVIDKILSDYNLPVCENITIYREISKTKAQVKVNGVNVTLLMLKNITNHLADVHVQHDTFRLFNKDTYISFIDPKNDEKFDKLYNDYQIKLLAYNEALKKYDHILKSSKESKDKLDYLEFTYKELSELDLVLNEDEILEEKIAKLSNFDKIFNNLKEAISNMENEYFSLDNIYNSLDAVNKISSYDKEYEETAKKIDEAYYNLDDSLRDLKRYLKYLDFDSDELDMLNERHALIENMKFKYKKSVNDLISYQEQVKLELDMINNYDEVLNKSYVKLTDEYKKLVSSSKLLTEFRKNRSNDISKQIESLCKDLELPHTKFSVVFEDVQFENPLDKHIFLEHGVDVCEFMISTNLGEPLKPLSKVASGGEMSRIMLAFKTFFAKESHMSLQVFDEIDSGVSGYVASQIAKKMKEISSFCQVLAITHLPQVAAISDNHYNIYKEERDGRTFTNIELLSSDDRVLAIAKMLSGEKISKFALDAAKELLSL